jgi:hypothetical protein
MVSGTDRTKRETLPCLMLFPEEPGSGGLARNEGPPRAGGFGPGFPQHGAAYYRKKYRI